MQISPRPTAKSAFTLIELLVVIAIIAILAAILFPVFAQAKVAAKKTATISNLKQQATSQLIYTNDYDDAIVPIVVDNGNDTGAAGGNTFWDISWSAVIQPYVKNLDMFVAPGGKANLSATNDHVASNKPADSGYVTPYGGGGVSRAQGGPAVSYGMIGRNYWIGLDGSAACTSSSDKCQYQNEYDNKTAYYDGLAGAIANKPTSGTYDRCFANPVTGTPMPSVTTSSVARPADAVLIMESAYWDNAGCLAYVSYPRVRYNGSIGTSAAGNTVMFGKVPLAYSDSHAGSVATTQLYTIIPNSSGTGVGYYKYFYNQQ